LSQSSPRGTAPGSSVAARRPTPMPTTTTIPPPGSPG
jgi:hypothetical protein